MKQKESKHIAIGVAISMVIIIIAWSIWFFPATRAQSKDNGNTFKSFANEIIESLSIFVKTDSQNSEESDINDLRERVFGDTIQR